METAPENLTQTLQQYWFDRLQVHFEDSYAGLPILKFPEDLRVYEHLIWRSRANVVIELGVHAGGSSLWFRDRLRALEAYGQIQDGLVIAADHDLTVARRELARTEATQIELIEGDVLDAALVTRIERLLPADARCFVVEDTAHTYETTYAALESFARFVPVGGFLVTEDTCVDIEEMRPDSRWPRGVSKAVRDWLATEDGASFAVRRELEIYGLSCHPGGFLERVSANGD
jgi:cephalosporin hydroxylase